MTTTRRIGTGGEEAPRRPATPATERAALLVQADRLRRAWTDQLEREFGHHGEPAPGMDGETLLEALMACLPVPLIGTPPEHTWIWSDLHLGDGNAFAIWNRPFLNVDQMNGHLLREWERVVDADDTIICLGDVTVGVTWRNLAVVERLRRCPGKRWLVLGNHDVHRARDLREAGFGAECAVAVYASDPPLVLTHIPLRNIPPGAVNVHGHIHAHPAVGPRRVNVSVERTGWMPQRMDLLLEQLQDAEQQRRGEQ